jgi:hypothetical protein
MEWFLKKALENPGKSYSPELVREMLDSHAEAIESLGYFCTALLIMWIATTIYGIVTNHKLKTRLKKLEK